MLDRDQAVVSCGWQSGCGGRMPMGFEPHRHRDELGEFLAASAALESASITAFRRLQHDLRELGSPPDLQLRARSAARDEVRHARTMNGLAAKAGGQRRPVVIHRTGSRSPMDVALENAVEGCVRETFGAALAIWQAEHAEDAEIRCAMTQIAEDEADHAQLAWDIADWIEPHLNPQDRLELTRARAAAVAELFASIEGAPSFAPAAGIPPPSQVKALIAEIDRQVWSAAA